MLVVWLTDFNSKTSELEGEIPRITGLATNSEINCC